MSASSSSAERGEIDGGFWVRQGWKFLLGFALAIGLFGVGDLVMGLDADPATLTGVTGMSPAEVREASPDVARFGELQVRARGIQLISWAALWSTVLIVPFRGRQRWAWWAMWTFPAWALSVAVTSVLVDLQPGQSTPPSANSGWVLFSLTALVLLVTRRGFRSAG